MKFFSWVHKRFHHPLPKDLELADLKVEKSTTTDEVLHTNDKDTQALLKKVVLIDALDGWKEGILAIGTFGFDPLKPFNLSQKEYLVLESEEDDDEESQEFSLKDSEDEDEESDTSTEDEEVNPLMLSTLGHSFKDVNSSDAEKNGHVLLSLNGVPLASNDELATLVNTSLQSEEKKKVGRTTLADLFLADADVKMKLDSGKVLPEESTKKMNVRTKKSLSFAKKLIPKVKEETSPIKNLQRLMRRMMKRKIHPEALDVKVPKSEGQKAAGGIELVANAPKRASESVSLLAM
ncbi:NAD-dependent protein deacetylase HST1-like protein [Parasponia andersonii]|uniref:Protein TILLER ANGLE CONTROL 1 n=1 Tax=Parasponia andersonii TaxID=3476 RepID=A0A2P5DQA9_PARAD|nr:NAD-dependent protein deacetylase HST1-like protein [Parasponia andersonii]